MNKELLKRTAERFYSAENSKEVLIGFDGFIDNILRPVKERKDHENYTPIEDIITFSDRIRSASGKSMNIEIVKERSSMGGNGPIMANSLIELGNTMNFIGSLGENEVLPIFKPFTDKCKSVISFSDPGITDAFEMNDGKVMFNYPQTILNLSWEMLLEKVGLDKLREKIHYSRYLAFVNWTMIPMMNGIFEGLFEMLSKTAEVKTIYIDLTDPKKRSREDLKKCLDLLMKINENSGVILGLNESEAVQVAEVLNASIEYQDIKELAENIHNKMQIKAIVIHSIKQASVATEDNSFIVDGPYTPNPKLSTGAGDIFNAGFYGGYMAGLKLDECLATGVCNSGFYVRNERPATKKELIEFMRGLL
ncbi:MAG: PfkB family carbohydrate kinase [Candidatus Delongbacteria bacterium]|nr:PfkB family carbohydrate kinase [Candidatus Delongbacteria bacterium]